MENIVSHIYGKRKNNAYVDHGVEAGNAAEFARRRIRAMLGFDEKEQYKTDEMKEYGLGTVRTLEQYEKWIGLSLKNQTMHERCDQVRTLLGNECDGFGHKISWRLCVCVSPDL